MGCIQTQEQEVKAQIDNSTSPNDAGQTQKAAPKTNSNTKSVQEEKYEQKIDIDYNFWADEKNPCEGIDIEDITRDCVLIEHSGTYRDNEFSNVYDDLSEDYWSSSGGGDVFLTFDCGSGCRIDGIILRYYPRYRAETIEIQTSDDARNWSNIQISVESNDVHERAITFKNAKPKQFVKLLFPGISQYCAIEFLQFLGTIGMKDASKKLKNIASDIPVIEDSGTSNGYPIKNVYKDDREYWCSKDATDPYWILDTMDCKISAIMMKINGTYNCTGYSVTTSKHYQSNSWEKLANGTTDKQVDLNQKNERYIKIAFTGIRSNYVGVDYMKILIPEYQNPPNATNIVYKKKQDDSIGFEGDITKAVEYVCDSGQYSGYPIEYAYSEDDYYWCSDGKHTDNCYVIFNAKTCKIDKMNITQTDSYYANNLTILTSDKFDENNESGSNWKQIVMMKIEAPSSNSVLHIDKKNEQYIKVLFSNISGCGTIQKLKFEGSSTGGTVHVNDDEKKESESQLGVDITKSIKYVKDSGTYSGYKMDYVYTEDDNYWCSDGRNNDDIWVIFDTNTSKINYMSIAQNGSYYGKKITVFTCYDIDDNKWEQITSETFDAPSKKNKIEIDSKNKRYIKLVFSEISSYATIQRLNWFGAEGGGVLNENDVTKTISVIQCSESKPGGAAENVLKSGDNFWSPVKAENSYLIFDCDGHEIDEIVLNFIDHTKISKTVQILLSDVGNDYSFTNVLKTFNFVFKGYEEELTRKLDISALNGYNKGYKQFLQLKFIDIKREQYGLEIKNLSFFGAQTSQKWEREEKVDINVMSDATETSLGKINIIQTSKSFQGYEKEQVFMDNKQYWMSGEGNDAFFIFDLTDKYVNEIKKIQIKLINKSPCEYCEIFTSNKLLPYQSSKWTKIGGLENMNVKYGFQSFRLNDKDDIEMQQYVCIRFYRFPTYYIGIQQIKFIGNGLDEDFDDITLDDVLNSNNVVDEKVSKYLKILDRKRDDEILSSYSQLAVIEKNDQILTKEWINKQKETLLLPYTFVYKKQIAESKLMKTIYEEKNAKDMANERLSKAESEIGKQLQNEINEIKTVANYQKDKVKCKREYFRNIYDGNASSALIKRKEYVKLMKRVDLELKSYGVEYKVLEHGINSPQIQKAIKQMNGYNSEWLLLQNEPIFLEWCKAIDSNPKILSNKYSVYQYLSSVKWAIKNKSKQAKEKIEILANLLDNCLKETDLKMHKFHLFLLSEVYDIARPNQTAKMSKIICDRICQALNDLGKHGKITNEQKHFCKFLCCWQNKYFYNDLLKTGKRVMNILKQPLIKEYSTLQTPPKAGIISLELKQEYQSSGVKTNFELLKDVCVEWGYEPRKVFYEKDLKNVSELWKKK
eukprot:98381_1